MPNTVPESVKKEQYLLKSTFFYNKLTSNGYFDLFEQIQRLASVEGSTLDWSNRGNWSISPDAWDIIAANQLSPMLVFAHPKIIKLYPTFLKYYRSIAMVPQKGLKALSHISIIDEIEEGTVDVTRFPQARVEQLISILNEFISLVINLSSGINESEIQGMMYATAGTNIDGAWRNQIGNEGERVIRSIIFKELDKLHEIVSVADKDSNIILRQDLDVQRCLTDISNIKTLNLINGYSVYFSSEPDVTLFASDGTIAGVIEIKAGLDPAGALERLGAIFKSFENTLAEYPSAVTILVISCITDEVRKRLDAATVVRQTFVTTNITASDSEKRKFVNRLRVVMKLAAPSL